MKLQMMDYSLLLGVHDCEVAEQENRERLERPEGDRHLKKKMTIIIMIIFVILLVIIECAFLWI